MPHRYFTRELADGRAALTGSDAHHLADVMRARIGEEVVLCGPDGLEYLGTVTAIEPGRVEFSVTDGTTSKAEPDCAVTLFAGYPKAGKLEEVIRHSVELGVTEVVPFFSRYCVATPKKEDIKNERYNRIAAEAAARANAGDDTAINRDSIGRIIHGLIDEMDDGTGWVRTSRVGDQLIKRYPDFDVRNFGSKSLNKFLASLPELEVEERILANGNPIQFVRVKPVPKPVKKPAPRRTAKRTTRKKK